MRKRSLQSWVQPRWNEFDAMWERISVALDEDRDYLHPEQLAAYEKARDAIADVGMELIMHDARAKPTQRKTQDVV